MSLSQTGVGPPHNSVELEKLFKEAGFLIINSLSVDGHCNDTSGKSRMDVLTTHIEHADWSQCTTKSFPK